jgi:CheY-like chemotaxis protein
MPKDNPKKRVLIVENSKLFRMNLRDKLLSLGYEVHEVANGSEGERIIREHEESGSEPLAAVVSDVTAPGTDGLTLLEKVRSSQKHSSTPVVVFSAHDDEFFAKDAERFGATAFSNKSLSEEELHSMLQNALKSVSEE